MYSSPPRSSFKNIFARCELTSPRHQKPFFFVLLMDFYQLKFFAHGFLLIEKFLKQSAVRVTLQVGWPRRQVARGASGLARHTGKSDLKNEKPSGKFRIQQARRGKKHAGDWLPISVLAAITISWLRRLDCVIFLYKGPDELITRHVKLICND